jgi:serine/threonine protein kinase/predicted ATPase/tetratricopeptide (TPR) repeat protein
MSMTPELWKEIEELYHAAVDQGPEIRDSLLANARAEVRSAVRQLLSPEIPDILHRRAWEGETTIPAAFPLSSTIAAGSRLGPYRIETSVGVGGMGEVFRASDTRLARSVAIKAIRAGRSAEGLELRFLEEARAASALNHPNIITIYDIGTVEGQLYIVMEWIEGQTLRQKLAQGPLPVPEVLGIASQILDALAAAHEEGIIHRDLKPENIMVNATGRVKVLDFGIAKRTARPNELTRASDTGNTVGLVVGTPGYMSPEQTRGEKIDFRSDQFSYGALLYELATGRRAFRGDSEADVQAAILLRQPESLTSLNPQAPAPLQWLVERCLAKSSRDRFESTEELRRQLSAIVAGAGQRTAAPSVNNIPAPRTSLIGREGELARLGELVTDPDLRILTLTGPGGIGKTRLAMELGRQVADRFAGGACFVQLEKVSEAGLVPSEVARALGVAQSPGVDAETATANHLRQLAGPVLILLDNFEHVLEAALFVSRLASERLKVVVTSRAALRVYGEYEFAVPPLSSGQGAERSPAVTLFLERAPGLRNAANNPEQLRIVGEICNRLDGLPLAIELAAARTRLFPLKTLQARLNDPLAVLVGGARDLPQRQHTLRATLDWSYNLLDAEHRKLFRRMAVFVGGATIEAIEAVCDTRQDLKVDLWGAIELLVDNSLVRRIDADDAEPRFALLETMREYGLERLGAEDEEGYARKAHAAYCLVLAEGEGPALRREHAGKHRFGAELGNFRAALDWLVTAGEAEWGLRLMGALHIYFFGLRLHVEARDILTRLLAIPGVERFPHLRNFGTFCEADFSYEADGYCNPAGYYLAWRLFEEADDRRGMLQVAHRLAFNAVDHSERRQWAERTVELARATGQTAVLAGALSNLADLVKEERATYARALYVEAMRLFESSGDHENAIWSLSHQADLYSQEGDPGQARTLYSEALKGFRQLGFSLGVASCLFDLGGLDASLGRYREARRLYQECLRLYGPENPAELPRGIESLAEVAIHGAQLERALMLAGAAAAIRERFFVLTRNPVRRAEVARKIDDARREAGPAATAWWMKGWNMSVEETLEYALQDGDDSWTNS